MCKCKTGDYFANSHYFISISCHILELFLNLHSIMPHRSDNGIWDTVLPDSGSASYIMKRLLDALS